MSKIISFLGQAVLVVVAVLAFSFLDPFNIFNTKKLYTTDTSLIIESTKDIGELITAEFYGEVMAGSQESFLLKYDSLKDSLNDELTKIHKSFIEGLSKDYIQTPGTFPNWKKIYERFLDENAVLIKENGFATYWDILADRTGADKDHKILKRISKDEKWSATTMSMGPITSSYVEDRYSLKKEGERRKKQRLVMLGRGWVKAGIDLDGFNEEDFRYSSTEGIIRISNRRPRILSTTINPWLSPKHEIKGWEIVEINGKARKAGHELVKEVKLTARNKLIEQAEAADILNVALVNAEQSLSSFFSLVLDKEIEVRVFANLFLSYEDEYLQDDTISTYEIQSAVTLIKKHIHIQFDSKRSIQREWVNAANFAMAVNGQHVRVCQTSNERNQLSELPLHFLSMYYRLTENNLLDTTDLEQIEAIHSDSLSKEDFFHYMLQEKFIGNVKEKELNVTTELIRNIVVPDSVFAWYTKKNIPEKTLKSLEHPKKDLIKSDIEIGLKQIRDKKAYWKEILIKEVEKQRALNGSDNINT